MEQYNHFLQWFEKAPRISSIKEKDFAAARAHASVMSGEKKLLWDVAGNMDAAKELMQNDMYAKLSSGAFAEAPGRRPSLRSYLTKSSHSPYGPATSMTEIQLSDGVFDTGIYSFSSMQHQYREVIEAYQQDIPVFIEEGVHETLGMIAWDAVVTNLCSMRDELKNLLSSQDLIVDDEELMGEGVTLSSKQVAETILALLNGLRLRYPIRLGEEIFQIKQNADGTQSAAIFLARSVKNYIPVISRGLLFPHGEIFKEDRSLALAIAYCVRQCEVGARRLLDAVPAPENV